MAAPVYTFGEFRLDLGQFLLTRQGHAVRLERKPLELLMLFASTQGRLVTRAEIAECLWGKEVFVDTEHGINTAVRKIRTALRDDPEAPRFVQTVTGMGYRFIAEVEGVEESNLKELQTVDVTAPAAAPVQATSGRRTRPGWLALGLAGIAIALCAFIAVAARRRLLPGSTSIASPGQPIRSVAILPLANYSGDPNQEYFADGMTDELITRLVRDSTLRIPSRTSVMQYRAAKVSLAEIAKALGVDGILEGSVTRSSTEVHLNLQLIRADSDTHLWAESYDRNLAQAAALPDEAARAIADRLKSVSPAQTPVRYVNPAAHDAYYLGRYFWSVGRNEEAGRWFERAVALQPDYALGWAGVSQYYSAGAFEGQLRPEDALPKAEAAAENSVALDDGLPQAHLSLAAAIFFRDSDGQRALREVLRATDLDRGFSQAYHLHALILCAMGRFDEALAVQKQSTAADPIAHPGAMAEILLFAHQYDRSLAEAEMRLRDFPEAKDLLLTAAEAAHVEGSDAKAAEFLARLYSPRGDNRPSEAVLAAFHSGGYKGVVGWRLAESRRLQKGQYVSPMNLAHLYAELGDREQTFSMLAQAAREHDPMFLLIDSDPAYNPFHADTRYSALVEKMGLR